MNLIKTMVSLAFLAILLDQATTRIAANSFMKDPHFFENVLEEAHLFGAESTANHLYQECQIHPKFFIYYSKTCFSEKGQRDVPERGGRTEFMALYYWPPLSVLSRPISNTYYNDACCREVIYFVTKTKEILESFIDG